MLFGSRKEKKAASAGETKNGAAAPPRPAGPAVPVVEPTMPRNGKPEARPDARPAGSVPGREAPQPGSLPHEEAQRRADYSHRVMQAFGAIVAVYMRSKSHREMRLADIESVVGPAVTTGQFSLAEATHKKNGLVTPVAIVLWASVSDAIDRELSTNPARPLKLAVADWKSGDHVWIIEAIGEQRMLGAMLKQLQASAWKDRDVKMRAREDDGGVAVRLLGTKAVARATSASAAH